MAERFPSHALFLTTKWLLTVILVLSILSSMVILVLEIIVANQMEIAELSGVDIQDSEKNFIKEKFNSVRTICIMFALISQIIYFIGVMGTLFEHIRFVHIFIALLSVLILFNVIVFNMNDVYTMLKNSGILMMATIYAFMMDYLTLNEVAFKVDLEGQKNEAS